MSSITPLKENTNSQVISEAQKRVARAEKLTNTPEAQADLAIISSINGEVNNLGTSDLESLTYNASSVLSGQVTGALTKSIKGD